MAQPIDELINIRREKLAKLKEKKIPGYPAWSGERISVAEAREKKENDSLTTSGRITGLRGHGKMIFADLTDSSGKIQISLTADKTGNFSDFEFLDIGDFISVSGTLYKTQAGELTVDTRKFSLLTKSIRPLPSAWYGLSDTEERYRQRYLDLLINPQIRNIFAVRSKVVELLRKKLNESGFTEVETPVLQPIYGGATAKPFVTHHNALDIDLFLRISDELYLKRLIIGGWDKVFEIGKDFRNEGIDRQHNPEFTQAEFYWAYANYEDLMSFTEDLLSSIVLEIKGSYKVTFEDKEYDFTPPWPRVTYRGLVLKETGVDIDKADTFEKLREEIIKTGTKLDLSGVAGFAALLDTFYKQTVRPKITGPMFLTDHPVSMKPLAKRKAGDGTKAASFQLLVAGAEWINAYNELNDPEDQKNRWEEEMKLAKQGLEEYQMLDEDYIRALEYGMPPTAGWGLGIDRFVAFLTDQHTLKEVILFPTMRPEK